MTSARRIAFDILVSLEQSNQTLDAKIEERQKAIDELTRKDRALLHALVYGVQRWRLRLDWIIDHFSDRPGKKTMPAVHSALRMGLFQLCFMDRIPPSAAVNTSVDLIKNSRERWAAGFVNAVLRRAAAGVQNPLPEMQANTAEAVSIRHAFPIWIIQRWLDRFGPEETEALCHAINTIPAITLRTNTLRTTREALMTEIESQAAAASPTPFSPEGVSILAPKSPMTSWPAYRAGWFQVQDEAAQLIGHLLAPAPDQQAWDACAGLGTKTIHIAQLMENRGNVVATDHRRDKLESLTKEASRLGIGIIETRALDLSKTLPPGLPDDFDRILVDAPCSGLGVLKKNPDGKWRVQPEDLKRNRKMQSSLLANAARRLKPAGILVYSVCSVEPEETVDVIEGFLQIHRDFAIAPHSFSDVKIDSRLISAQGYLCTLPHRHAMDGFFAAALERRPLR